MKYNHLHVAISSDDNYIEQASVLINSMLENNRDSFDTITVHFLSYLVNPYDLTIFKSLFESHKYQLKIYDLHNISQKLGIGIPNTIAINAYARLFLSSLISPDIGKVIYMDVDAINVKPLDELWSMDISSYSVCGVLDDVELKAKTKIGLSENSPYINSGFLLINLDYWRKYNFEDQFIRFLRQHNGNVFHHDQGIINAVCNSSFKILPPKYNVMTNFFLNSYGSSYPSPFYSTKDLTEAKEEPIFIHFTPGVVNRPWCKKCKHPMVQYYLEYRTKVGLFSDSLRPDNRPLRIKLLCWSFFRCPLLYRIILHLRSKLTNKI